MVEKLNLSETYNEALISTILPMFDCISLLTIILTSILIAVIVTQTPKQMNSFKPYLLSYSCFNLLLGICLALYCPIAIHPYFALYPLGYIKLLPPIWSTMLLNLAFHIALAVIDSFTAMALERFFALKSLSISKIPSRIYRFLLITDFFAFAVVVILFIDPSIRSLFMLYDTEILNFMKENFVDFGIIDYRYLTISTGTYKNNLPQSYIIFAVNPFLHVLIALMVLLLNFYTSRNLNSAAQSTNLQKFNKGLLRMTFIQFFAMFSMLGVTFLIGVFVYIALSEPSKIPSCCIFVMNAYCLFDIFITIFLIEPYKKFLINIFKKSVVIKVNASAP